MGEKSRRKGAFQENILELLQENIHKGLTCNEIAESLGRSIGSTSGTLSALSQKGRIIKSDDYPAKYLYNQNYNNFSIPTSSSDSSEKKLDNSIETNNIMIYQGKQNLNLTQVVTKLGRDIEVLNKEIEERAKIRDEMTTEIEKRAKIRDELATTLEVLENKFKI